MTSLQHHDIVMTYDVMLLLYCYDIMILHHDVMMSLHFDIMMSLCNDIVICQFSSLGHIK